LIILGIETSCDETSLALYETGKGILASCIHSQIDIHTKFGGVVPEVASRNHILKLEQLFNDVLDKSGIKKEEIDLIGVTNAPGLIGALFVGVAFAKTLGYALNIPVLPVNHLSAHILSAELENDELLGEAYLALIISGGHTHIYDVDKARNFRLIAKTIDDAAGESFDKVAKMLNMGYPGGPLIEKTAKDGNENKVELPIAMRKSDDFSFSGLKTAVLTAKNKEIYSTEDIAASFQKTVAETLALKTLRIARRLGRKKLVIAGGVACNTYIREHMNKKSGGDVKVYFPSPKLCTDNGDMVAYAASIFYKNRKFMSLSGSADDIQPEFS